MKREIKFRGLRKDGGGWAFGNLWLSNGRAVIDNDVTDYPVIPETVGQFTGVTDRDDRAVYEGDIIDYNLKGFMLIVEFIGGCFCLSGPDYPKAMHGTTTQGRVTGNIHEPCSEQNA